MQFSISFAAISALLVTGAFASPQRRPNRVTNVNNAPNQQANSCGNGFTPFCCSSDRSSGPAQVACSVSSNIGGICDGTFVCCNSQNVNVCLGNTFAVINSNNNVF